MVLDGEYHGSSTIILIRVIVCVLWCLWCLCFCVLCVRCVLRTLCKICTGFYGVLWHCQLGGKGTFCILETLSYLVLLLFAAFFACSRACEGRIQMKVRSCCIAIQLRLVFRCITRPWLLLILLLPHIWHVCSGMVAPTIKYGTYWIYIYEIVWMLICVETRSNINKVFGDGNMYSGNHALQDKMCPFAHQ